MKIESTLHGAFHFVRPVTIAKPALFSKLTKIEPARGAPTRANNPPFELGASTDTKTMAVFLSTWDKT